MKLYINGLTIEGTHSEMADFAELCQMRKPASSDEQLRSLLYSPQLTPEQKDAVEAVSRNLRGVKIETVPAGTAHIPITPPVVDHIKAVEKRYKPIPSVKHTDVVPADAPVTVIPTGVSGKPRRAASNGLTARMRFAIFNGKTTRAALKKALNIDSTVLSNNFYALLSSGCIEEASPVVGRTTDKTEYRLTEKGLSFILNDKILLTNMGILKEG